MSERIMAADLATGRWAMDRLAQLAMLVAGMLALTSVIAPAVGAEEQAGERPSIVVTTEVLGAVVSDLAGDAAEVTVLMPSGADPHTWQPSARDTERLMAADLIVANGLGLEEGLLRVLEEAEANGVPLFRATDHITVRAIDGEDVDDEHAGDGEDGHDAGPGDPHFWLDPIAMREVAEALEEALLEAGIDVGDRGAAVSAGLGSLHAEVEAILAAIPAERRSLVTGHASLGYFADRYDLRVVGTVIPGLSTSGEPSARDIAELIGRIRAAEASAVLTEVGTPAPVAAAVASETGARIVEIQVEQLPEPGSYASLIRTLASAIAEVMAE